MCSFYQTLMDSRPDLTNGYRGWKQGIPFLYYEGSASSVLEAEDLNITVAYRDSQSRTGRLSFFLSVYTLNGTWLGYEELTTQLQLCGGNKLQMSRHLNIGHLFQSNCNLNLYKFIQTGEPLFYELYFRKGNTLYPIPVQLLEGEATSVEDASKGKLYRRFFLVDNISGKPTAEDTPSVIQFLEYVELRVNMRSNNKIYPPLLALRYSARKTEDMTSISPDLEYANYESIYTPKFTFKSTYRISFTSFWITFCVFAAIAFGVSLVVALTKTYFFIRRRAVQLIDVKVIIVFLWKISSSASYALSIVLIGSSIVHLLFFKIPASIYLLSPLQPLDLTVYYIFVPFAFVGKMIDVVCCIFEQCNMDIFFIDWEKTWGKIVGPRGRTETERAPISIWRMLFIAKMWSKLQTKRMINLEVTISVLMLFLIGYDLELLATEQPYPNIRTHLDSTNPLLRLAVVSMFWIGIVSAQYCLKRLYYRFIKDPVMTFVDLCSLSNISVFVLPEAFYGYYIHGESVHPHADDDMKSFNLNLEKEAQDTVLNRGLVQEPNMRQAVQTFQIYVPHDFRTAYNERLLIPIAEADIEMKNQVLGPKTAERTAEQSQPQPQPQLQQQPRSLHIHSALPGTGQPPSQNEFTLDPFRLCKLKPAEDFLDL